MIALKLKSALFRLRPLPKFDSRRACKNDDRNQAGVHQGMHNTLDSFSWNRQSKTQKVSEKPSRRHAPCWSSRTRLEGNRCSLSEFQRFSGFNLLVGLFVIVSSLLIFPKHLWAEELAVSQPGALFTPNRQADQPTTLPNTIDLAGELGEIEPLLPSIYLGLRLFPTLPKLIGLYGPQHYLIVVQNSDELRATGGFISAVGVLTLEQGRIANLDFVDSYDLYHVGREYPPAPPPVAEFMGIPYILFRDANWSPDFPTTAAALRSLYREETRLLVDGIVTVDLHAMEAIVGALEPLQLSNSEEPLTGANVVAQVKAFWTQPEEGETITDVGLWDWWEQRKNFIPALATAMVQKLGSGTVDYVAVGMAVEKSLNERAIQIWLADEEAATQLRQLGWDGSLQPQDGADYLALINTNMGYNKVNAAVEQTLSYAVTWPDGAAAPGEAIVTIDYHHPRTVADHECDLTPRYGTEYEDLVNRCFFNYVRLYVPGGSELMATTGLQADSIRSQRGEKRTTVFSGYFILLPGESNQVQFQYQLPNTLTPETYKLLVQRQSGSGPLPLSLSIEGEDTVMVEHTENLYWMQP